MTLGFDQFIKDVRQYVGEPKCILEIGSRDCQESLDFIREFPDVEIHAFEPCESNHLICRQNSENTQIKLWKLALCDKNGESDFFCTPGNIGCSSLAKPHSIPWTPNQKIIVEKVRTSTLDTWTREENVKPDVVWIDVQSQELSVFQGGREALKTVKAIYTEAGLIPYYENHSLKGDIINELEQQGFTLLRDEPDWEKETNLTFVKMTDIEPAELLKTPSRHEYIHEHLLPQSR